MKREIIKEFDMLGDALSTLNAQFARIAVVDRGHDRG